VGVDAPAVTVHPNNAVEVSVTPPEGTLRVIWLPLLFVVIVHVPLVFTVSVPLLLSVHPLNVGSLVTSAVRPLAWVIAVIVTLVHVTVTGALSTVPANWMFPLLETVKLVFAGVRLPPDAIAAVVARLAMATVVPKTRASLPIMRFMIGYLLLCWYMITHPARMINPCIISPRMINPGPMARD
jgi:hypothetical protein